MEAAAAGGTSNSDLQDNSEKPVLSHTVSLPSPTSAADGGIAGVLGGGSAAGGTARTKAGGAQRSKSVRQAGTSSKNKVWSFGDMAKAVGCGVTAFGSNVVNTGVNVGTAVGTGVYHGTVAVGTNVVEGTKVAGRVTKDVTMAAGKGVVQAGEMVGTAAVNTGKVVTSASVSAVKETTEWVIEQTELESQVVHVVLPGEDLSEISKNYR